MRTHDHRTLRREAPATGLMHKLFAKPTRLPATATLQEQDWDHDVPTVKLSTAFMVILFLHVAVVGGVMLFYFLQRDPGTPVVAMPEQVPPAAVTVAGAPASLPMAGLRLDDPALANLRRHVVKTHETVDLIAGEYGVTRDALATLNRIDASNPFRIGMTLVVPETPVAQPFEAVAATDGAAGEPDVRRARAVAAASDATPAPLEPRVETARPARTTQTPVVARVAPAAAAPAKASQHTVRSGETLWSIAKRYGVTLPALMKANAITDASRLQQGATLRIP